MEIRNIIFSLLAISLSYSIAAQIDTTSLEVKDVTVIKAYDAQIVESNPIQVDPVTQKTIVTPPSYDYTISVIPYDIKDLDIQIRPLAIEDEEQPSGYPFYGKIGYGNIKNPYAHIGYQLENDDLYDFNFSAKYHALDNTAKLPHQAYHKGGLGILGNYRLFDNTYFHVDVDGTFNSRHNRNMITPEAHNYIHTQALIGMKNVEDNSIGFDYGITLGLHRLDIPKITEETSYSTALRLSKSLFSGLSLFVDGDLYIATNEGNISQAKNQYYGIQPGLKWKSPKLVIRAAYDYTVSDKNPLPFVDVYASYAIYEDLIQLYVDVDQKVTVNNNYLRYLQNPYYWVNPKSISKNTISRNYFAGLRSNINNQVTLDARIGWVDYTNFTYFDSTTSDGKFIQKYIPKLRGIAIKATALIHPIKYLDLGVTADLIRYEGNSANDIFNLPTMTLGINAAAHFFDQKLVLKLDGKLANAIRYHVGKSIQTGNIGSEINAELQINLTKNIGIWARGNNLLDNKYLRYKGNPLVGIHVLGGLAVKL